MKKLVSIKKCHYCKNKMKKNDKNCSRCLRTDPLRLMNIQIKQYYEYGTLRKQ